MHWFLSLCVLLFVSLQPTQAQPDPNVCIPGPGDAKNHTLPTLPEQYKVTIDVNIVNKGYTMSAVEYYDDINNRGSILYMYNSKPMPGRSNSKIYYDYKDTQYYVVYPDNTCVTQELTNHTFATFGYHYQDGKGHINSAKDVFKFGEQFNETYMGQTTVNDVKADWWSTCIYDENSTHNYRIDFYFSVSHPESPEVLPIRMVLNGTGRLHWNSTDPARRSFYHIYTFSDVDTSKQPDDVFLPPLGVVCPNRFSRKDVPDISTHFDLSVEVVQPADKTIHYIMESYNFDAKLVAYRSFVIPRPGHPHRDIQTPVKEVHDYNTGISYRINAGTGLCHINPIPTRARDAFSADQEHVVMRNAANFFQLQSKDVSWVYEGKSVLREVEADVWISPRSHWKPMKYHQQDLIYVNSSWEYYFATNTWTIVGEHMGLLKSIPLQLVIDWTAYDKNTHESTDSGKEIHNFFQYTVGMTKHNIFEVAECYTKMNESLNLAFNLEGKDTYNTYVVNNTGHFCRGATDSIARSVGISSTRIAHLHVVEGYHGVSTIFFTLLDKPWVTGDAINATDPGPALNTVYKNLQQLVNSKEGSMLVMEFIYKDTIEHVNAATTTLREETTPLIKTEETGLSTGTIAGMAVGAFVLGIAVTVLVGFIVYKRQTSSAVPYTVQD